MPYYAEELRFDGTFKSAIYADKPLSRSADGSRRRFRFDPIRIEDHYLHLTISQLREIYSPDGRFQSVRGNAS